MGHFEWKVPGCVCTSYYYVKQARIVIAPKRLDRFVVCWVLPGYNNRYCVACRSDTGVVKWPLLFHYPVRPYPFRSDPVVYCTIACFFFSEITTEREAGRSALALASTVLPSRCLRRVKAWEIRVNPPSPPKKIKIKKELRAMSSSYA